MTVREFVQNILLEAPDLDAAIYISGKNQSVSNTEKTYLDSADFQYIKNVDITWKVTNKKGEEIYDVEATIYCLRNSHKGIIIGKNGEMLKRIGTMARKDMEQNFGIKINLKTWVKVKEDWLDNDSIVNKFKLK
jgi:GTPase Era involved in 16S rRNA processing